MWWEKERNHKLVEAMIFLQALLQGVCLKYLRNNLMEDLI